MIIKYIALGLITLFIPFELSYGQSISLDSITGTMWNNQPDSIMAGSTYTFNIRFTNGVTAQTSIVNGFRIYSDDNATWTTTTADTTGAIGKTEFDIIFEVNTFSNNGSGADTIGFFASKGISGSGLVSSFDDIVYTITVGPIPNLLQNHGQTICLDSAFFQPSGVWKWVSIGPTTSLPNWDGPYCYTIVVDVSTSIDSDIENMPTSIRLAQNYPNPFNPTTTIQYDLPKISDITLTIYNIIGQKVSQYTELNKPAGENYSYEWDASSMPSGIYFYQLAADDYVVSKKMLLLK